jgi:hypothetical protein
MVQNGPNYCRSKRTLLLTSAKEDWSANGACIRALSANGPRRHKNCECIISDREGCCHWIFSNYVHRVYLTMEALNK